jgi:hypothetical protein
MSEEKTIKFKSGACIEFFGEDNGCSFVGFNSSTEHLGDIDAEDDKCCDEIDKYGE